MSVVPMVKGAFTATVAARLLLVAVLTLAGGIASVDGSFAEHLDTNATHNNWVVIVASSRYFFNFRHGESALAMYHTCRNHGIDDDHIIFFLADSYACDPRNNQPGEMNSRASSDENSLNLYGCSTQVDFAGEDVDVRHFLEVLQGRFDDSTPPTRRLDTDENSHILIYIVGHGAEGAFKFQDTEFLDEMEIAETFNMMWQQKRYKKIVFMPDTCHAVSLCRSIEAPNVLCVAASSATMDSYSHHGDHDLGVAVCSIWTYESLVFMEDAKCSSRFTEEDKRRGLHTALQESWYEFNYGIRRKVVGGPKSIPDHRDVVNQPGAIHEWKIEEFWCGADYPQRELSVVHDLL